VPPLRTALILIFFLLISPVLAAPSSQESEDVTYRFANLTQGTGVDLYRNNRVAFFGIAPGQVSAERVVNSSDAQIFRLFPENANPETSQPLVELGVKIEPGTYVVIVARQQDEEFFLEAYARDLSSIVTHRARLQVIHAAERAPDIAVVGQNEDVLIDRAAYITPVQADIPGGNYQISIVNADQRDEVLAQVRLEANAGTHSTLLVYGSGEAIRAQSFSTSLEQKGLFRFVHAASMTAPVDVYMDDIRIFENIPYQGVTEYTEVGLNAGSRPTRYTLALYPTGADAASTPPLLLTTITISANFAVTGLAEQGSNLRLITHIDDLQQMSIGRARVRFVNAALNLPLMTVTDGGGNPIVDPIEYPNSSSHRSLTEGTRTLIFKKTEGARVHTVNDFDFQANHFYVLILVGDAQIPNTLTVLVLDWNWKQ